MAATPKKGAATRARRAAKAAPAKATAPQERGRQRREKEARRGRSQVTLRGGRRGRQADQAAADNATMLKLYSLLQAGDRG
jgi:hypothetical protein